MRYSWHLRLVKDPGCVCMLGKLLDKDKRDGVSD